MLLSIEKNNGLFKIRPTSGNYSGRVVATAEHLSIREGKEWACTLRNVWGLMFVADHACEDVELLKALNLFGRRT